MDEFEKCLLFDAGSADWMEDCTREVGYVCQVSEQRAREMIEEVLRFDKLAKQRSLRITDYRKGANIPPEVSYVIQQITQPLRIPGPGRLASLKATLDFIEKEAPQGVGGGTILDYGGGGGRDSIAFARRGLRTTLLETGAYLTDPSNGPAVSRRFEGRGLEVEFMKLGDAPKSSFDYVNCVDVLEHCYDVEYALAEITYALKGGGHLFVWGDFDNVVFNGDHLEKNRFYVRSGVWPQLMRGLGYELARDRPQGALVEVWRAGETAPASLEEILIRAYQVTKGWAEHLLLKNHAKSVAARIRDAVLRNGQGGPPPYRCTLQNLADTVHTLDFATERLRLLESPRAAQG